MKKYCVVVRINNSPTKVSGWGYIIKADTKEEAVEYALKIAQARVNKKYSRYKRCTLSVEDEDVEEMTN